MQLSDALLAILRGSIPVALLLACGACSPGKDGDASSAKSRDAKSTAKLTIEDSRAFYASQHRLLRPVGHSEVPAGLVDLRAESCGLCHVEIYNEWKVSTHARAWEGDAQFLEELKKTTAKPGRDASWSCMNCHTPFEAQLPRLVAGLEDNDLGQPIYIDNPYFDPVLQKEAITCATCHVRDGVVLGPFGGTGAPHPVRKSEELLSPALCTQCHEADHTFAQVDLTCIFDTGTSFQNGPWAAEGKTCQSCHMPEVVRPLANTGTPPRVTRRHWFGGSRIPKHPDFAAELEPLKAHYKDGATLAWTKVPRTVRAGSKARLSFQITNAEAGHTLPTGDVERFLLITAKATDATGTVLAERTERIGTTYQWYPTVEKLGDNRLAPRESRDFALEFDVPAQGPVTISLEGTNHRINAENFAYMKLDGRYVPSRVFYTSSQKLEVRS